MGNEEENKNLRLQLVCWCCGESRLFLANEAKEAKFQKSK